MQWVKGFAIATCLATSISSVQATLASAETAAQPKATTSDTATTSKSDSAKSETATDASKKPSKEQIKAMLAKCSDEADAKGLFVNKGKGAARKAFRRECMRKKGVEPKE